MSEPNAPAKWKATVLSLVLAVLLMEAARANWRLELIHSPSSKVVLSWKSDHESALGLKATLERDLAALTPEAFEREWNIELPRTAGNG